jgi:hypothetical protein
MASAATGLNYSRIGLSSAAAGLTFSSIGLNSASSGLSFSISGLTYSTPRLASATSGLTYSTLGLNAATSGLNYSTTGLNFSTSGLTWARTGLNYSDAGLTYLIPGLNYFTSGLSYSTSGLNYSGTGLNNSISGLNNSTSGLNVLDADRPTNYVIAPVLRRFSTFSGRKARFRPAAGGQKHPVTSACANFARCGGNHYGGPRRHKVYFSCLLWRTAIAWIRCATSAQPAADGQSFGKFHALSFRLRRKLHCGQCEAGAIASFQVDDDVLRGEGSHRTIGRHFRGSIG